MKTLFRGTQSKLGSVLAGAVLMLMSGFAVAAGIADTKHNLGTSNILAGTPNEFSGTGEICVFCHTPHGASTGASAPLWNRTISTTNTYTRYSTLNTSSFDALEAPITGSVSIACLSCHDGTQAMDVVINAPGSGSTAMSGSWTGSNVDNATGKMISPSGLEYPRLGDGTSTVDLRNDHPVSMQYGGGGMTDSSPTGSTTDPDFAQGGAAVGNVNSKVLGNGLRVWYIETTGDITGGQQKDDIALYSRTDGSGSASGVNQPFVECASCHDPHSANSTFLRIANDGSKVCLACHVK